MLRPNTAFPTQLLLAVLCTGFGVGNAHLMVDLWGVLGIILEGSNLGDEYLTSKILQHPHKHHHGNLTNWTYSNNHYFTFLDQVYIGASREMQCLFRTSTKFHQTSTQEVSLCQKVTRQ